MARALIAPDWLEQPVSPLAAELAAALELHPLAAAALARRGLDSLQAARGFLDPAHYAPASPHALPGMGRAVQRIGRAILAGEALLVWGDFDVDGQTATALLASVLGELGGQVYYHIPVRAHESHGVGVEALRRLLESGAGAHRLGGVPPPSAPLDIRLVLTCDTGIAAFEAAAYLQQAGIDLIITDHHELPVASGPPPVPDSGEPLPGPGGQAVPGRGGASQQGGSTSPAPGLPPALAILTPRLLPPDHPLAALPGVGVAYELAQALCDEFERPELAGAQLDLVALGIVADVARLAGDTRYLLQRGLAALRDPQRAGLLALYERAGLRAEGLSEAHIAFVLAPRLNALGRLGDANPAVELLATPDAGRARLLAVQLEGLNGQRQLLTSQVLRGARAQIEADPSLAQGPALVLAHPEWDAGVIGIVASRLVELYHRPVVMIRAPASGMGRGSARSVSGVHITQAIASQAALLQGYGGHAMAAGLSIASENIAAFRRGLQAWIETYAGEAQPRAPLAVDGFVDWSEADLALAGQLERLAPFGEGNPPLVLACRNLRLASQASLGRDGEHLLLTVQDASGAARRVIWWGGGEWAASGDLPEAAFDLAFSLRSSTFAGQRQAQIEFIAWRPAAQEAEKPQAGPLEIVDCRREAHPLAALKSLLAEWKEALPAAPPEEVLILAEGEAPGRLAPWVGSQARLAHRGEMRPCRALVVWTAPASPAILAAALEQASPSRLALFAVEPPFTAAQECLDRLAGLVKGALAKEGGRLEISRLAAALAQREAAVRHGLEWLAASGHIRLESLEGGAEGALLAARGGAADAGRAAAALAQLRAVLDESRAYRAYYRQAQDLAALGIHQPPPNKIAMRVSTGK